MDIVSLIIHTTIREVIMELIHTKVLLKGKLQNDK